MFLVKSKMSLLNSGHFYKVNAFMPGALKTAVLFL